MSLSTNLIHSSSLAAVPGRKTNRPVDDPARTDLSQDSVQLGGGSEAVAKPSRSFSRKAANVLSFVAIGSGIAIGAATSMIALPAVLLGVGLVSGAMSMEKGEGSKLGAWMDQREARQAAGQDPAAALHLKPA